MHRPQLSGVFYEGGLFMMNPLSVHDRWQNLLSLLDKSEETEEMTTDGGLLPGSGPAEWRTGMGAKGRSIGVMSVCQSVACT